jgi:hypothetical protein
LFLLGIAASTFGIGYHAYHDVEMFQSHTITWQRGLGISSKTTDGDYLGNGSITITAAFAIEIN